VTANVTVHMTGLAQVLKEAEGIRVAVDCQSRTYTGLLSWAGPLVCVTEDDGTLAWINCDAILGVRIFNGKKPS